MDKDFGAYELRDRIGKGGMAWVYLAVQKNLDRPVALKILFPHLAEDDALVARFQLEAKSAAAMRHENVCQVYDFGRHGDQFYIAMEYVEGKNLREWIDTHGPPPLEIALLMLRDICRGLEHAHRRSIIHRDIKPSNVMFTPEGLIKLMDFGLARRVEDRSGITMYGAMLGTPAYMSPEQARGEKLERPTTDIFSFGIVCYELLGGLRPFQGDSSSVARAIMYSEPRPLDALDPLVPPVVETMIRRMLEKNVEQRVQTVAEVRHAFDAAIQELGIPHERELLADFAADPAGVGAVLRTRRLTRHLELAREAEARHDATALLRENRCVLYLDPDNEAAAAYVREHDVPSPLGGAAAVDDLQHTVLWAPGSRPPSIAPEKPAMPPSRPGTLPWEAEAPGPGSRATPAPADFSSGAAPPSSRVTPPAAPPGDEEELTVMFDPTRTPVQSPPVAPPASRPPASPASRSPTPPASRAPTSPASRPPASPASRSPASPASRAPAPPPSRPPAPPEWPEEPAPASAPARRLPVPVLLASGTVLLLLVAGIAFFALRRPARTSESGIPVPGQPLPPGAESSAVVPTPPLPSAAAMMVNVVPDGAHVAVDGGAPQPAPARFSDLAPGTHTVRVTRDSFQTARRVIHLSAGQESTLALTLRPAERGARQVLALRVATDPPDATVVLDGEPPQPAPAMYRNVSAGEHTVVAKRDGFANAALAFTVGAQPETTVTLRLVRAGPARIVTIHTRPGGAQVSLDGAAAQREPGRFDGIHAGVHRARASQIGYADVEQTFALSGQRDTSLTLTLAPQGAPSAPGAGGSGATATLDVWLRPAGTVLLDRAPYRTDVESVTVVLQAGREYLVGLQPKWGGTFVSEPVRLQAGQSRLFGYDFRGSLARIDVTATGGPAADILLDGKPSGLRTPNTLFVGPGSHKIELALEGWTTREGTQSFKLKGGQSRALSFTLARP